MVTDETTIKMMGLDIKNYFSVTKNIVVITNRLTALEDMDIPAEYDDILKGNKNVAGLATVKGRLERQINRNIQDWGIWTEYLQHVPGIGPIIAGNLIMLYYYRHVPICKKCKADLIKEETEDSWKWVCHGCKGTVKGDGVLQTRIEHKDFPTISKWWAYMGRHTVDGAVPTRKKGVTANWSAQGKLIGRYIGDSFEKMPADHPYKKFIVERRARHDKNNPKWPESRKRSAAKNETVKLFLAHFWHVARTLEGKEVSAPYSGAIMGHTNLIDPFFWEG